MIMKKYYEPSYANKFYKVDRGRNFIKQVTKTDCRKNRG